MMKRILFLSDLFCIIDMFNVEYRSNCGILCSFVIVVFIMAAFLTGSGGGGGVQAQFISNKEHRTFAVDNKQRELWCYHCNTMESGERCEKLVDNRTDHHLKCKDEKMCMVKSISLTTNSGGNSTSQPKLWLLERNCTKTCEPGCIVIGERTKLYACTKCCEMDFCNSGRSVGNVTTSLTVQSVLLAAGLATIVKWCSAKGH